MTSMGAGAAVKTATATAILCRVSDRTCRNCGCHDYDACVVTKAPPRAWNQPGQPCWWVEDDLCSACTDRVDPRLTWRHGGQYSEDHGQEPMTLTQKVAFAWVSFAMLLGSADLVGLIG